MDSAASTQSIQGNRIKPLKYALTPAVIKSRATMKKTSKISSKAVSTFPYVAFVVVVFIGWSIDWSEVELMSAVKTALLMGIGVFTVIIVTNFLVQLLALRWAFKKVGKLLNGDHLATTISQDLSAPEELVQNAVHEMITNRSGWSNFTHNDEVIKLKLSKKWDDYIAGNVHYVKVTRTPAVNVREELIGS